ncbi:DUF4287 domain-containing protein [Schumannella soli]|uniref:DUF4287 domain-containing protein n=1 Tax=Schumannella soli TaxID=2590779 RepID=A0A506Y1C1_9MICO|nr:hypothetical protein [Schumannella soli]TPW75683.1 hypothetical protein FJ657_07330 [Schumannella soli]
MGSVDDGDRIAPVSAMTGDSAVRTATGRAPEEWFALLDAAGAVGWGHTRIARWLADAHGVDGWWAQGVTVRFEQARGLRHPGQKADGTFAATASRTVADAVTALEAVITATERAVGVAPRVRREHPIRPNARWTLEGGAGVLVAVEPAGAKARITLTFDKLPDEQAAALAKTRATGILEAALAT